MGKKRLILNPFSTRDPVQGAGTNHAYLPIEAATSENSLIRFHLFRPSTSTSSRRDSNNELINPDILQKFGLEDPHGFSRSIRTTLNSLMDALSANLTPTRSANVTVDRVRAHSLTTEGLLLILGRENGKEGAISAEAG